MKIIQTKTFVSTKAELLDQHINEFLKNIDPDDVCTVWPVMGGSSASYLKSGVQGIKPTYYIGVQILYWKDVETEKQLDIFQKGDKEVEV